MSAYGSAVGKYYVHYYAQSYRRTEGSFDLISYAQQRLQNTKVKKSRLGEREKKRLKNTIEALMKRSVPNDNIDYDKYFSILENSILKGDSSYLLDRVSGQVTKLSNVKVKSQPKRKIGLSEISADKFVQEFNVLAQNFTSLIERGQQKNKAEFDKNVKKLEQFAQDIVFNFKKNEAATLSYLQSSDQYKNSIGDIQKFFQLANIKQFQNTKWIIMNPKEKEIIQFFNDLLSIYQLSFVPATILQGTHMENIVAVAADIAFGKATEATENHIKQVISQSVVGGVHEEARWNFEGLSDSMKTKLAKDYGYTFADRNKTVSIKSSYSQGKIDVNYSFVSGKNKRVKEIKASVKSVQSLTNIHIVNETTAWNLLNSESSDYVKHYLNILAARERRKENIFGIHWKDNNTKKYASLYKAEEQSIAFIKSQRVNAFLSFKIIAAYKALTGDVLGRDTANFFIVNNIKGDQSQVYILEMKDIIDAILNEVKANVANVNKLFSITGKRDFYTNDWVPADEGGEWTRNYKILQELHEEKISVVFKDFNALYNSINKS